MRQETKNIRPYTTKSGLAHFKPSNSFAMKLAEQDRGFCLACGSTQAGVEPDAARYACAKCKALKVFGAEELVMMGLTFHA